MISLKEMVEQVETDKEKTKEERGSEFFTGIEL